MEDQTEIAVFVVPASAGSLPSLNIPAEAGTTNHATSFKPSRLRNRCDLSVTSALGFCLSAASAFVEQMRERKTRVFFEEPIFDEAVPRLDLQKRGENLWVVTPHIQNGLAEERINIVLQSLIYDLIATQRVNKYLLWYYTPMALSFTHQLNPQSVIYDCMDELSAFKGAPAVMRRRVMTLPARFRLSAQPVRTE